MTPEQHLVISNIEINFVGDFLFRFEEYIARQLMFDDNTESQIYK